jgi:hypothetical protein
MLRPLLLVLLLIAPALADEAKPVVAVFPFGGDAEPTLRERTTFAIRAKLDRLDAFTVIDGYRMRELAETLGGPVTSETDDRVLRRAADSEKASILVWGDLTGGVLRTRVLDLRDADASPQSFERRIDKPTDLRFATEAVCELIPGVGRFQHPSEEPLINDPISELAWQRNPNLQPDGDFDQVGDWRALLGPDKYPPPQQPRLPVEDKVAIVPDETGNPRLVLNMGAGTAATYGLACLGGVVPIEPNTRYRLSFRYRSDGPVARVFVKGYTTGENLGGRRAEREVYRRQVPTVGDTKGQWKEVVVDLNPQHRTFRVEHLRVDLYVYLHAGLAEFDDVVLKEVGQPTRRATDDALDLPVTRPGDLTKP